MIRVRNLRGALAAGAGLILLGGWLLARNLDVKVPGLEQLWPALPLIYGVASLVEFFAGGSPFAPLAERAAGSGDKRRRADLVFTGVGASLMGAFFFLFTLGEAAWDWAAWWPALVLIAGAAYLAHWLAQPRDWDRLMLAAIALIFGGLALAATQGVFSRDLVDMLVRAWPALLILAGLGLLTQALIRRRRP